MKKQIFKFFLVCVVMAMPFVACNDDEDDVAPVTVSSELKLSVVGVTDSTAIIGCEFAPLNSVAYQVRIGEMVSDTLAESTELNVTQLEPGRKYFVEAVTFDSNYDVVGTANIEFTTTSFGSYGGLGLPVRRDTICDI